MKRLATRIRPLLPTLCATAVLLLALASCAGMICPPDIIDRNNCYVWGIP